HRDRCADADDFTFTFVGNVSLDSLRPLVERYLGSLPARPGDERARDNGVRPPDGVVEKIVRKGLEPQAMTQIVFSGPFTFDEQNRHLLRSLADMLEIRLRDELREELGGTYGVAVGTEYANSPREHYAMTLRFGADPDRIDDLVTAAFGEIDRLRTAGPDTALVTRVQELQRRELEQSIRQNAYWLTNLSARA